ncbi:glycosyltransferase [Actinoplanes sp. NEAU-A12]|uniref:Glycosyltransferase n=1 Tax=Actinoplanes sandaracinus TaxID=3045177 RepID=A0ABT6WC65_9ACTN|nr:glycosyltransferase [Actinoplanes sandaracinus]MDI6097318.1 glycosyltransferase [Actinoplanes sandaracinus]
MRVLHVISTLGPGGAGHQLRLLVRRLPYESEIATLGPPGADAEIMDARVHRVTSTRDHDPAAVRRLRQLMHTGRYDIVHTHLYRACVQGRIAARLAGVPHVVATEHHLGTEVIEGRRASAAVRALYLAGERLGQITIAPSPVIAGRLRAWGVPERRITTIPKAIDTDEFRYDPALRAAARARLGIAPELPVIGGVGRLEPDKRFDLLIRAITEVPEAVLLLAGDGSARADLERLAQIEGVADRVLFTGAVTHPRETLCAMDVFASPGQATFGLATLEAVAAGLPAVYGSCVPLEERAAARAAIRGTHRLSQDRESLPRALRAEMLCLAERRGARLPSRSAGVRYDADHLVASVGRLYEGISARPVRRRVIGPLLTYRGRFARFGRKNSFPLPGGSVRNA